MPQVYPPHPTASGWKTSFSKRTSPRPHQQEAGRRDWDWIEIGLDFFLGIDWLGLEIGLISFLKFLDFSWEVIGLFGGTSLTSQRNFLGLL